MNLTHVIPVNIIQSSETFMYFINYLIIMHFAKKYVRIKIEDHKILVLIRESSRK